MPTLIVKPLDMAAPGSYAARRLIRVALRETRDAYSRIEQLRAQGAALEAAAAAGNPETVAAADAFDQEQLAQAGRIMDAVTGLEDMVIAQARTEDGSPVEAVLEQISAEDFDKLLRAMIGEAPVPTKSSGS